MDAGRFNSAYRLALGIAVLYVLWMFVPHVKQYVGLVATSTRRSQASQAAARQKLSAATLAIALRQAYGLGADAQMRCEAADRDWDYVCSYIPTALPRRTRLQFGVEVDAKGWTKLSSVVPVGTAVPPPQ